jgi:hypothetical protein
MGSSNSSGMKPLCDTCNRNKYPCRCPRASQEIIISCAQFIRILGAKDNQPVCAPVPFGAKDEGIEFPAE